MDLCQIHMEDMLGPSLDEFECQGHQGQKKRFFSPFGSLHAVHL